jgi:CHAT domain-containing protein
VPRDSEAHIGPDEIDRLLAGGPVEEGLRAHLESCSECAQVVVRHGEAQAALQGLRKDLSPGREACPRPEVWWRFAAGLPTDSSPAVLLDHAAACSHCSAELQAALQAAQAPEEAVAGAENLAGLGPEQRASLARRMEDAFQRGPGEIETIRRPARKRVAWWYAAAAAVAVAAIAGGLIWYGRPTTGQLIAQAYSEKRTVEFRLPGASYSPLRIDRAAAPGQLESSAPLLEAELRATQALARNPDDAAALDQKARTELLEWNYNAALPRLLRANQHQPDNVDILLDLALAYFERGETENQAADYGTAVETLSRVLTLRPGDRVALFNRALTEQRLTLYREAERDWEEFLRLEPSGGWADEARDRLQEVRKKIAARDGGSIRSCPDLTASLAVKWDTEGTLGREIGYYEGGYECLRQRAVTEWLPRSLDPGSAGAPQAHAAFLAAARLFREAIGDTWLLDLGRLPPGLKSAAAARLLGDAVGANVAVDASRAEMSSEEALAAFRALGNQAGESQALIEHSYAIRRSKERSDCPEISATLIPRLERTTWTWTLIEARLELASCLAMGGDQGAVIRLMREVVNATRSPVLGSLYLRALSYQQGSEFASGEYEASWQDGVEGLRAYWNGHMPAVRGYQLYFYLASAAAEVGDYQLALRLRRASLAEIQLARRPSVEAFVWFDYGRTALLAKEVGEAQRALSTASRLFDALPRDTSLETALAESQADLAEIDNLQGRPAEAMARLEKLDPVMRHVDSYALQFNYREALAEAEQRLGRENGYEADLKTLGQLAAKGFSSLDNFRARMEWASKTADVYRNLTAEIALKQGDPRRALEAWEQYRSAPYRSPGQPALAPFEPVANPVRQALVYVALKDRLLIWLVRGSAITFRSVPVSRAELEGLAQRLYVLCDSPQSAVTDVRSTASQLAGYLLTPVEPQLQPGVPLEVELDDALSAAPFNVLPLSSGRPAGLGLAVAFVPALAVLGAPPIAAAAAGAPAVAVGISTLPTASGVPPLPGAVEEAREVAAHYSDTDVLLNERATRESIERDIARARVFHFAGHSWNTANHPGLLVAPDQQAGESGPVILDADAIARMNLSRLRLAVISACSTERPRSQVDPAPFGFALGLLRAGARDVLATRWDLDSDTAVRYTREFYDRLNAGQTSIRAAQAAAGAIRNNPATQHPYYWASYQFFGSGS